MPTCYVSILDGTGADDGSWVARNADRNADKGELVSGFVKLPILLKYRLTFPDFGHRSGRTKRALAVCKRDVLFGVL